MRLGQVRAFFSDQLKAMKLREWTDGFNTANIPANIIDGSFHVAIGSLGLGAVNQQTHDYRLQVSVKMFFKGYTDPQKAKDVALDKAQEVMNQILKPTTRLGQDGSGLKDIRPVSAVPTPLADSNDNSLILELVFECFLIYRFS